jgi:hypothetical protein
MLARSTFARMSFCRYSSRTSDRRLPQTFFQYVEEAEGRRP